MSKKKTAATTKYMNMLQLPIYIYNIWTDRMSLNKSLCKYLQAKSLKLKMSVNKIGTHGFILALVVSVYYV